MKLWIQLALKRSKQHIRTVATRHSCHSGISLGSPQAIESFGDEILVRGKARLWLKAPSGVPCTDGSKLMEMVVLVGVILWESILRDSIVMFGVILLKSIEHVGCCNLQLEQMSTALIQIGAPQS